MNQKGVMRQPAVIIILSIVTCGIYSLVWMYLVTEEVKQYLGKEDINSVVDIVLVFVTCGIYYYYWSYRMGQNIVEMQRKIESPVTDDSMIYLILAIFGLGIVNMAIMQTKLNEIWTK